MTLQCWKCGEPLRDIIYPFSRYEVCSACNADQHVCLLCKEYDPAVADSCREERAESVLDKEKANFCDFFKPRPNAFRKSDNDEAVKARARLAELFGEVPENPAPGTSKPSPQSEADKALEQLKRLFGE